MFEAGVHGGRHKVFTKEGFELQHTQTDLKTLTVVRRTWLVNVCLTDVQKGALSFFVDDFISII